MASLSVAAEIPHPEHPRPDLRRDQWLNLNGTWAFEFDEQNAGEEAGWFTPGTHDFSKKIVVPFPWQSQLSGIERTDYDGVAWYSREVVVPSDWEGKHAWLVFGAVDWSAKVWVNGKLLGEHVGGYTPFACNLAEVAGPGEKAVIVVRAEDRNQPEQPAGKQHNWYTHCGGIWQTVYLEARGGAFLDNMELVTKLRDDNRAATVSLKAMLGGEAEDASVEFEIKDKGKARAPASGSICKVEFDLAQPKLWSPDTPHLYDIVVRVLKNGKEVDRVYGYVGVREFGTAKASGRDYKYITLNGKPVYLLGDLHQSFHPNGVYQYPDDKTLRWDYEYAKRIGINFLRIHIKTEIPRALYWADKLGILIMEDQPNFSHYTERSQRWWEEVMRATVARDFNHPSIFSWCNFNETWGIGHGGYQPDHQKWVAEMYHLTKQLDPTRLVEDNSPCRYDHVVTDINSWHFYINDYARAREHIADVVRQTYPGSTFNYAEGYRQSDAPLINSEYGGISAGLGDQDISWCFKYLTNELRKHDKICGYVYTEQSDIEWEHNGFLNYDRTQKVYGYDFWFPGFSLADLNAPDFIVLDVEPCPQVEAGQTLDVPLLLSHWSDRTDGGLTLHWQLDCLDRWGIRHDDADGGSRTIRWKPYEVVPVGTIEVAIPEIAPAVGALRVWVTGDQGESVAANYINVQIAASAPRIEVPDGQRVALRFSPRDFCAWQWEDTMLPTSKRASHKVHAQGSGFVEYEVAVPEDVPLDGLKSVTLLAELSAKAGDEKLAWPARKKPVDYPQTDKEVTWPTDVVVSMNGIEVGKMTLADDPADARGVLSHRNQYHPGSYGWRVEMTVTDRELLASVLASRRVKLRLCVPPDTEHRGGLAVFGENMGRYPMDPTLVFQYGEPHGLQRGTLSDQTPAVNRIVASRQSVIATADDQPETWRYTTERPAGTWQDPGFNDSAWKEGRASFGTRGTPNAAVNSNWNTSEIWLRKTFDVEDPETVLGATLRFYHDEDVQVFLNGRPLIERRGYVVDYVEQPLSAEEVSLLKARGNVLAVHCRQTTGGQNVDAGLQVLRSNSPQR
jgi:hypothetical protein